MSEAFNHSPNDLSTGEGNVRIPKTYVEDSELAHDMANAERPFREEQLLATSYYKHLFDTVKDRYKNVPYDRDDMNMLARTAYRTTRIAAYLGRRAAFEGNIEYATQAGETTPSFNHGPRSYAHGSSELEVLDSRKREELLGSILQEPDFIDREGLNAEALELKKSQARDIIHAKQKEDREKYKANKKSPNFKGADTLDASENPFLRKMLSLLPGYKEVFLPDGITGFSASDDMETRSLFEGHIRKQDIGPRIYEFLAKSSWQQLLDTTGEDIVDISSQATKLWKSKNILSTAESLVAGFNGTVTDVSVLKLPLDEEWVESYFDTESLQSIYPDSIQRLQFIATLKSSGRPESHSVLNCVQYVRETDSGPCVAVTTRKADRVTAEALIRSHREESIGIHEVLASQNREILSGLPSLGKRY